MRILPVLVGIVVAVSALGFAGRAAAGGEQTFQNRAGQRTSLVELYTSEGCSSCPPADAWLSRLTTSPQLWTEIVPVAFHVDYWDNLGWRDRFASPAATARQRAYAACWGSDSVYTPGFVLDGGEWRGWSGFGAGELPANARQAAGAGRLSAVVKEGKTVTVSYRPADRPAAGREVSVALLGCDLNSNVKAGENRGRSLRHDFVALSFETKKLSPGKSEETAAFDLSAPPADAKRLALAVWVEEPAHPGVLQAVGGWLTGAAAGTR